MPSCDFRVQCGRCDSDAEQQACTKLWLTFGILYGVIGLLILAQNSSQSMAKKPDLLRRVLSLWGFACLCRVVGAVILATHTDEDVHPIVLEMLWHVVWLCGCFALTYFITVILNVLSRVSGMSLKTAIPVSQYVTCLNLGWALVFVVLSIADGLNPGWPRPGVQWLVWMFCAIYLFAGTCYAVFKLDKLIGKTNTKKAPSMTTNRNVQKTSNMMNLLRMFSWAIILGLGAYSLFLPCLAILRLAFAEENDVFAETIITAFHQVGMLCMGLGMQFGTSKISERYLSSKGSKGTTKSEDPTKDRSKFLQNTPTSFNDGTIIPSRMASTPLGRTSVFDAKYRAGSLATTPVGICKKKNSAFIPATDKMPTPLDLNLKNQRNFIVNQCNLAEMPKLNGDLQMFHESETNTTGIEVKRKEEQLMEDLNLAIAKKKLDLEGSKSITHD